jgi:tetratricopeptide (TPR) repeat protein
MKYKKCCLSRDEAARPKNAAAQDRDEPFIAELNPDIDDEVDQVLARLESGAGRAVEPELKALLEKYPRYHSTHYAMGVFHAAVTKDHSCAMAHFEKAVQIFPPLAEGHFNLGNAARFMADIPKAVAAYRAAIRYSRNDDGVAELARRELEFLEGVMVKNTPFRSLDAYLANEKLFDEAFVCLANREFEKAAELFKRVLSENPEHPQSFGNLALAYAGLGRRADAMECFDRALALDPDYGPALLNCQAIARMTEGEPFIPEEIRETKFYTEKVLRGKPAG